MRLIRLLASCASAGAPRTAAGARCPVRQNKIGSTPAFSETQVADWIDRQCPYVLTAGTRPKRVATRWAGACLLVAIGGHARGTLLSGSGHEFQANPAETAVTTAEPKRTSWLTGRPSSVTLSHSHVAQRARPHAGSSCASTNRQCRSRLVIHIATRAPSCAAATRCLSGWVGLDALADNANG